MLLQLSTTDTKSVLEVMCTGNCHVAQKMADLAKSLAALHDPKVPSITVFETLKKIMDNERLLLKDLEGDQKVCKVPDFVVLYGHPSLAS